MKRRIAVVTGTRAEYGHLFWLLREIDRDPRLGLQLIVTGMHLSPRFGSTWRTIHDDGFHIAARVPFDLSSDRPERLARSTGQSVGEFAKELSRLRPDIIVVLGDRFELLAAATAAMFLKVPIAHIHGGESTEGVIDEAIRHSLTKMAHLHFPSAVPHRRRLLMMGEDPRRVFMFGAPGLDHLHRTRLLTRKELEKSIGFLLDRPFAVVTLHPTTLEDRSSQSEAASVVSALKRSDMKILMTGTNADPRGKAISARFRSFAQRQPHRARYIESLGQVRYLSALRFADVMVGNSSSGIIEAPSLGLPVVNVGDRQRGRLRGHNVIDCESATDSISRALKRALSSVFRRRARQAKNPYDPSRDGNTSMRIKEALRCAPLGPSLLKKKFYDAAISRAAPNDS